MAEQGCQRLEAECQKLRFACGGESPSTLHCVFALLLCLVMNQLFFLGLRTRVLSNQEEKVVVNQKMLELDNQLAALTTSRQALYDIVLRAGRWNAKLVLRLDEARLQVDPLISKVIHCDILAA